MDDSGLVTNPPFPGSAVIDGAGRNVMTISHIGKSGRSDRVQSVFKMRLVTCLCI